MHYICKSPYTFDEICEQCRQAVNSRSSDTQDRTDLYAEVRKFYHYDDAQVCKFHRMKDYGSLVR